MHCGEESQEERTGCQPGSGFRERTCLKGVRHGEVEGDLKISCGLHMYGHVHTDTPSLKCSHYFRKLVTHHIFLRK